MKQERTHGDTQREERNETAHEPINGQQHFSNTTARAAAKQQTELEPFAATSNVPAASFR